MLSRRTVIALPALAASGQMALCIHRTTSAGSNFRKSLEGYARAGIRHVEVIPRMVEEFVKQESVAAAKRLLADLGLKGVSSGGVRGLAEPILREAGVL
jgi:sugar phosphate isomerase/epimerase